MRHVVWSLIGKNWVVFAAALAAHGVLALAGPISDPDGSLYAGLADQMLRGDWSGILDPSRVLWTKTIFIALIAGAKALTPAYWPSLIVALNVVCSAATAALLVSFVRQATESAVAAWVALLFYAVSFDVVFLHRFITTDPLYAFFATAAFVLAVRPVLTGERPRSVVPLVVCLILTAFTRPPGVVMIALAVLAVAAFWPKRAGRELPVRYGRLLWVSLLLAMAGVAAVRTYIVQEPSRWPSDFLRPKIESFAARENDGAVVMGRASTYRVPPPQTYADHLEMLAERFVRFFQFVSSEFSPRHNLVNAIYFVSLYALALLGVADGLRTTDRRRRDFVLLALLCVGLFAYYHAVTILDGLWRYRTPLLPQMIVLAACGADALRVTIASRRRLALPDAMPDALPKELDAVEDGAVR